MDPPAQSLERKASNEERLFSFLFYFLVTLPCTLALFLLQTFEKGPFRTAGALSARVPLSRCCKPSKRLLSFRSLVLSGPGYKVGLHSLITAVYVLEDQQAFRA